MSIFSDLRHCIILNIIGNHHKQPVSIRKVWFKTCLIDAAIKNIEAENNGFLSGKGHLLHK